MNSDTENMTRLESQVAKQLAALPLRRSPATLEAQVMRAIAEQAAQPWYRSNFRRWPLAVQILFAMLSVLVARWLILQFSGVNTVVPAQFAGDELRSSWSLLQALLTAATSVGDSLRALVRTLPTPWLVLASTAAVTSYAMVAGGSAFVYRSIRR